VNDSRAKEQMGAEGHVWVMSVTRELEKEVSG
jgi:hypothetical protein